MRTDRSPQKTILIADDDLVTLMILRSVISKAGYSILTAENGADALRIARAEAPDVIVLDIMMPDMDGTEVANALKKNPRTRRIPIVFLSSLISAAEERSGAKGDLISLLSKPHNRERLLNEIRKYLIMKGDE
jgi:putative two-component system response regulator